MRVVLWLFPLMMCPASGETSDSGSFMHPGMRFQNLVYSVDSLNPAGSQVFRMEEAKVADSSGRLFIKGLRSSGCQSLSQLNLEASAAILDLKSDSLILQNGFRANGLGFRFKGTTLRSWLKSQIYRAEGPFEIQTDHLSIHLPVQVSRGKFSNAPFARPVPPKDVLPRLEEMTVMRFVQDFSRNLATFDDFWERIQHEKPAGVQAGSSTYSLIGSEGGFIDLGRMEIRIMGKSAILGPGAVLVSSKGMKLEQEDVAGDKVMRMTGRGAIRAWVDLPKSNKTWVVAKNFEYVSDRRIFQFDGGPLLVGRSGMILEATEDWQFARVMECGRVVLSLGSWKVFGTADEAQRE
jgi:hypothetical protein